MKKFVIQTSLLTISLLAAGVLLYSTILRPYYQPVLLFVVIFFYLTTNLIHSFLLKMAVKSGSRFTSNHMAISFLKMFFYLSVAVVFSLLNREYAKIFLANYLLLYAIYTTFEVIQISKFVRQKNI